MLSGRKIDLALEAKELAEGSPQKTTRLSGVKAQEDTLFGYPLTRVDILNQEGEAALGKPKGAYLTLDLPQLPQDREETLRAARAVAAALEALPVLPKTGTVLVAGLGNRQVTPDAIGPRSTEFLLVTRHLVAELPEDFGTLRPVAALAAGVTGSTGMESGEILGAVVEKLRPACLIAVDALAARRQERVCRTIQVSDTGIVPGGGGQRPGGPGPGPLGHSRHCHRGPHRGGGRHPLPGSVGGGRGNCLRLRPLPPAGGGVVRHPPKHRPGGGNPCPHPGPWDQHRPSCGFFRGRCGKVDLLTRYSTMLDK